MSEKKDIYWRAYLVYFGFVVLMLVVLFQTVSIQLGEGHRSVIDSEGKGERMPTRTVKREPRRGQILDANYTPLVTSVSFYNIHMDPTVVAQEVFDRDLGDLCIALNDLYPEKTARDYEKMIRSGRARGSRYLMIHKRATNEERKKLREMPIFKLGRFKGGLLDNEEMIVRKRPYGDLLSRTIGYVRWDDAANKWLKVGLEGAYDEYLKGEPGEEIEQRISTGWKKIGPVTKEAVEGATVVTTIDMAIQDVAHTELLKQLQTQEAERGCVIVMEVKTGYVKAVVNLGKTSDGGYAELYNYAIGTKEVPGSTFKLASLMALLEDRKVSISDKVNAKGHYSFFGTTMYDSNHGHGYGEISIQTAFEKSSNVFTELINNAYKSNPQGYVDRLKSFGLGDKLGIAIEGEKEPTLYEPGMPRWSGLSLPWMAVGYEFQQTPLQTLAFYNAVANNGKMLRPLFVKEVHRGNKVIEEFGPEVIIEKICSDRTLADLHKCLDGVVKRGTGKALQSAYFDIAGKTGTAQILDDKTTSESEKKYQASFVGYFPADDPIYSCIVVVSGPTKDIYGAKVSGTVFTAIANKVFASSLKYHKPVNAQGKKSKALPIAMDGNSYDLIQCYKQFGIPYKMAESADWVYTRTGEKHVELEKRFEGTTTVPNVLGMTAKDAVYLIERAGMVAQVKGYGKVVEQSLKAGENTYAGGVLLITLE